jgi:hypothetical protein
MTISPTTIRFDESIVCGALTDMTIEAAWVDARRAG